MNPSTQPALGAKWHPLLGEADAELARQSVCLVADDLVEEVRCEATSFDVSNGRAGQALALVYLSACLDRPALGNAAQMAWNAAVEGFAQRASTPALHGGFCGMAWVAAHLQEELCGDSDPESIHEEIESTLVAHLKAIPRYDNYDLISGLVGIGVYALERWPQGRSSEILGLIVERLLRLGEKRVDGMTWTTLPHVIPSYDRSKSPGGHLNLGLAHGIPGIITFLARVSRVGALDERGVEALDAGVAWLLRQRRLGVRGLSYPAYLPVDLAVPPEPSRLAWCYGDLGIAAALVVSAECVDRPQWRTEAIDLALRCAAMEFSETGVRDTSLCHGTAGIAHLFARLAQATDCPELCSSARFWAGKTLELRLPGPEIDRFAAWRPRWPRIDAAAPLEFGYERDPGFLTGAAGVALALAAGFSTVAPDWDRLLLVSG